MLPLNDCEQADAWLRSLAALSRTKNLTDTEEKRSITDLFFVKSWGGSRETTFRNGGA